MSNPPELLPTTVALPGDGRTLELESRLRWLDNQRITYRGRFGGQPALIKLYPASARRGDYHYRQELGGVRQLLEHGIITPALLYSGQTETGDYCVVTQFLAGGDDLTRLSLVGEQAATIGHALGQALSRLHDAGLVQADAHLGNFIYFQDQIWTVDGAGIKAPARGPGRWWFKQVRLRNLALVLAQLPVTAEAFAAAVVAGYQGEFTDYQIRLAVDHRRRRREQKYMRKTLRSCSEFEVRKGGGQRQVIRRDQLDKRDLAELLDDLDGAIEGGTLLKKGNSATLAKICPEERWLVIKRYNIKSLRHRLQRLLRPTRAQRSWQNGYRLLMWGLATPQPLALIEKRVGPLRGRAYLICEYAASPLCLEWYRRNAGTEVDAHRLSKALSATVAQLRVLGLSHGDLKADNLTFDGQLVQLLDLDSLVRPGSASALAKATHQDCQRLLRNWVDEEAFASQLHLDLTNQLTEVGGQTGFISG